MPLSGSAHIVSDRRFSGAFARGPNPDRMELPGDLLPMLRISGGHPSHTVVTANPATALTPRFVSAHQTRFIVSSAA